MATILCVLYEDPVEGYPPDYPRDEIPTIESYYDGQTTPTPERIDFTPGELLGCVSGELGLRKFLEDAGHTLIVTSDKDGPDSEFERRLPEADVVVLAGDLGRHPHPTEGETGAPRLEHPVVFGVELVAVDAWRLLGVAPEQRRLRSRLVGSLLEQRGRGVVGRHLGQVDHGGTDVALVDGAAVAQIGAMRKISGWRLRRNEFRFPLEQPLPSQAHVASLVDLYPTLLAALDVPAPPGLDGVDLFAPDVPLDRGVYLESYSGYLNHGWSPLAGWVDARGKYLGVWHRDGGRWRLAVYMQNADVGAAAEFD